MSRSGYYKWLKNKHILNRYEINRKDLGELIKDIHKRKPSYGYHRIRKRILEETQQAKNKLKNLENESWELATEIANSRSELMGIKVETAKCRAQKEELLVNIEEMKASADSTANAIYEKSLLEMSINLDQSADNMR